MFCSTISFIPKQVVETVLLLFWDIREYPQSNCIDLKIISAELPFLHSVIFGWTIEISDADAHRWRRRGGPIAVDRILLSTPTDKDVDGASVDCAGKIGLIGIVNFRRSISFSRIAKILLTVSLCMCASVDTNITQGTSALYRGPGEKLLMHCKFRSAEETTTRTNSQTNNKYLHRYINIRSGRTRARHR